MLMKSPKKRMYPFFAIGIGALAVYGAYSIVNGMKECCAEKAHMLTNVFKKKENSKKTDIECDEDCQY